MNAKIVVIYYHNMKMQIMRSFIATFSKKNKKKLKFVPRIKYIMNIVATAVAKRLSIFSTFFLQRFLLWIVNYDNSNKIRVEFNFLSLILN